MLTLKTASTDEGPMLPNAHVLKSLGNGHIFGTNQIVAIDALIVRCAQTLEKQCASPEMKASFFVNRALSTCT